VSAPILEAALQYGEHGLPGLCVSRKTATMFGFAPAR
jgi:hypothetical protein